MSKFVPTGALCAALLGSAAYLLPVTGFAQNAPAPAAAPTAPAPQPAAKPGPSAAEEQAKAKEAERATRKAFLDARLAALHAGLALTPAQAPLWTPVEAAIRDLAALRVKRMEAHSEAPATPLDRLKLRSARMIETGQALKALTDAAGPLAASLDAGQKERLPKLIQGAFERRGLFYAAFNVTRPEHDEDHGMGHEGMGREGMGREGMGRDHEHMGREGMARGEDHDRFGEGWGHHRHHHHDEADGYGMRGHHDHDGDEDHADREHRRHHGDYADGERGGDHEEWHGEWRGKHHDDDEGRED